MVLYSRNMQFMMKIARSFSSSSQGSNKTIPNADKQITNTKTAEKSEGSYILTNFCLIVLENNFNNKIYMLEIMSIKFFIILHDIIFIYYLKYGWFSFNNDLKF